MASQLTLAALNAKNQSESKPHAKTVKPKSLTISSWNINRGLIKKQTQIEQYLNNHNVDILGLQECDLKFYSEKHPFVISGYVTYSNLIKSNNDKTRLLLLVKEGLRVSLRKDLMNSDFCSIWVEIQAKKKVILGTFYREWNDGSHDKSVAHQRENLQLFLDQIQRASSEKSSKVVIVGDMNIDLNKVLNENYYLKPLHQDLESCLAVQGLVNVDVGNTFTAFRTREDGTTISSAIDHLYISDLNSLREWKVLDVGLSDHSPILAIIDLKGFNEKQDALTVRSFKHFNQTAFNHDLAMQRWEDLGMTENVDEMCRMFTNFFLETLNKHAPYMQVRQNKKKKQIVLSKKCLNLMRERDDFAKKIKNSLKVEIEDHRKFKILRNKVTSLSRKEKKENIALEIDRDPSSKNIWKIINNHISKKKSANVKIVEQGNEIQSNSEAAEIFNQYFHDKILGLRERINDSYKKDPLRKMEEKVQGKVNLDFKLRTVTEDKVLKILSSIKAKRSSGFDDISADLLKKAAPVICVPLTRIINTSIISGVFPETWKLAIVKPLFKKGKRCDKCNYRPISLLSAPSMILERVVRFQVVNYMEKNGLFGKNQFGFRSNKSTTGAILSMYSTCLKNADQGDCSAIALYDLSAAFDCLDADILCAKLERLGFDAQSVKWIRSYLQGRKQRVMVGDAISAAINLPFGSPQGSCLSPCLFIILLSDIELWVENSELIGYCDDTSGITRGKTEQEAIQLLESDAVKILEYMASNKLVINPTKTCIMINSVSGQSSTNNVLIGDESVSVEKSGKLLGVEISNDLTWNKHINDLAMVLNQRLSVLKRLKEVLMTDQLIKVGEALFNSKIRYGIAAYSTVRQNENEAKNSQMQRLQVLQNCMMRIILGHKKSDCVSVHAMLQKTGFLSINQLATYHMLQEMFSILNQHSVPNLVREMIKVKNEFHHTRQNEQEMLRLPLYKKKNRNFTLQGIKLWNALPINIRSIQKKDIFSNSSKSWICSNIPI